MELRNLGRSGLKVSLAGLGCNNFGMTVDEAQTKKVVDTALAAGVNFFDTADIYGSGNSEVFLGRALVQAASGRDDRDQVRRADRCRARTRRALRGVMCSRRRRRA